MFIVCYDELKDRIDVLKKLSEFKKKDSHSLLSQESSQNDKKGFINALISILMYCCSCFYCFKWKQKLSNNNNDNNIDEDIAHIHQTRSYKSIQDLKYTNNNNNNNNTSINNQETYVLTMYSNSNIIKDKNKLKYKIPKLPELTPLLLPNDSNANNNAGINSGDNKGKRVVVVKKRASDGDISDYHSEKLKLIKEHWCDIIMEEANKVNNFYINIEKQLSNE